MTDGKRTTSGTLGARGRTGRGGPRFRGCQARTVPDSKKNDVVLSVLPRTWWLVVATDVGRAVLACGRLADKGGCVVLACVRLVEEDGGFWCASVTTSEA